MDLQAQKLELIQWLAGVNNPDLIQSLLKLKKESVSDEDLLIQNSIEQGLKDIENGDFEKHEDVKRKYEKWLSK